MPKSDKRYQETPDVVTYSHRYAGKRRAEPPILGESQGDSGKTPSTTHSKNLPMTNNKRAGFKSSCIFDK